LIDNTITSTTTPSTLTSILKPPRRVKNSKTNKK
jgi:hypothetical protein